MLFVFVMGWSPAYSVLVSAITELRVLSIIIDICVHNHELRQYTQNKI